MYVYVSMFLNKYINIYVYIYIYIYIYIYMYVFKHVYLYMHIDEDIPYMIRGMSHVLSGARTRLNSARLRSRCQLIVMDEADRFFCPELLPILEDTSGAGFPGKVV